VWSGRRIADEFSRVQTKKMSVCSIPKPSELQSNQPEQKAICLPRLDLSRPRYESFFGTHTAMFQLKAVTFVCSIWYIRLL
jgi:hypothetical protein